MVDFLDGLVSGGIGFLTGGPVGAVAGVAGSLLGGSEADAAQAAGQVQLQASREAIAEQRRAEEQLRRDMAPYSGFGAGALGPLSTAIGITPQNTFGSVQQSPQVQQQGLSVQQQHLLDLYQKKGEMTRGVSNADGWDENDSAITAATSSMTREEWGQVVRANQQLNEQRVRGNQQSPQFTGGQHVNTLPEPSAFQQFSPQHTQFAQGQPHDAENDVRLGLIQELQSQLNDPNISYNAVERQHKENILQQYINELPQEIRNVQPPQTPLQQLETQHEQLLAQDQQQLGQQPQGQELPFQAEPQPFQSRADTLLGTAETNPLLQQAMAMRQDGTNILQNPLLQALQDDVSRRIMANQAAKGKLGSGSTLTSMQTALIPQALAFREQEIGGLTSLGGVAEDLRQREIGNLFQAAGMGQSAAARTGAAGLNAASNIGNLQTFGGQAQALGGLGASQARQNQIGTLLGGMSKFAAQPGFDGVTNAIAPLNSAGNILRGAGLQQQGPFLPTGSFD